MILELILILFIVNGSGNTSKNETCSDFCHGNWVECTVGEMDKSIRCSCLTLYKDCLIERNCYTDSAASMIQSVCNTLQCYWCIPTDIPSESGMSIQSKWTFTLILICLVIIMCMICYWIHFYNRKKQGSNQVSFEL